MKSTICLLLACSCACSAGRLRNSSTPLQPDVNATVAAAAQVVKIPEESKEKQMPRKVSMQIPDEEINSFLGKLSQGCETQYTAMFHGQGSGLDTFGAPGVESTAESCQSLNGSLCANMAHIAQESRNSSGRSMNTKVQVKGNGCLPKACISEKDLSVLAAFMHSKAKSSGTISGEGVDLDLHVDCTASGGSVAAVPSQEKEETKPAEAHKEEHHDDHKEPDAWRIKHGAKSSAFRCGLVAMVPAMLFQIFA